MTTSRTAGVLLHGDEAAELAAVLGQVEDWLLHTDELVTADLDRFLGPPVLGAARVADVVDQLGHYGSLIGRRHRGQPA